MPTDYHDDDSLDRYLETCGKINALITECDAAEFVIIGDYNCSVRSRFQSGFNELMITNKLCAVTLICLQAHTHTVIVITVVSHGLIIC